MHHLSAISTLCLMAFGQRLPLKLATKESDCKVGTCSHLQHTAHGPQNALTDLLREETS